MKRQQGKGGQAARQESVGSGESAEMCKGGQSLQTQACENNSDGK